jgi:LPS export ABC transporter protein LptC
MENVEYLRVRSSDPLARIKATRVERYEKQNLMKLENLTFEQYGERGKEINVYGKAGYAQVEIDTGDVFLDRNVRLDVAAEDIILETYQLEWKNELKSLSTGENAEIFIYKGNGTRFTGTGLRVDARKRFWEFTGSVRGTYIYDDKTEGK